MVVPQSSLIEIKTRTANSAKNSSLRKEIPQLYFSQTPCRYIAVHDSGNFTSVRKEEVGQGAMRTAEQELQAGLKRLCSVLEYIQQVVKSRGPEGILSIICAEESLKFYERIDNVIYLPSDMLALFHCKEPRE